MSGPASVGVLISR